jgi:hypothetical protein
VIDRQGIWIEKRVNEQVREGEEKIENNECVET